VCACVCVYIYLIWVCETCFSRSSYCLFCVSNFYVMFCVCVCVGLCMCARARARADSRHGYRGALSMVRCAAVRLCSVCVKTHTRVCMYACVCIYIYLYILCTQRIRCLLALLVVIKSYTESLLMLQCWALAHAEWGGSQGGGLTPHRVSPPGGCTPQLGMLGM
jgi:hypothetical protein